MTAPLTPSESQAARLEKLEREYSHLVTRLERLEKQKSSWLPSFLGALLLLLLTGLVLDYLGFFPPAVQRLPLSAKTVDTEEILLRGPNGKPWGKLQVSGREAVLTRFDATGNAGPETPAFPPAASGTPSKKAPPG
jgi:hypothetical protein